MASSITGDDSYTTISPMNSNFAALIRKDILRTIFKKLPVVDLAWSACVCRLWSSVASDREFQVKAFKAPWKLTQSDMEANLFKLMERRGYGQEYINHYKMMTSTFHGRKQLKTGRGNPKRNPLAPEPLAAEPLAIEPSWSGTLLVRNTFLGVRRNFTSEPMCFGPSEGLEKSLSSGNP
ncbi:unnamed protein product [Lactuca saligna]|uniref:F-box domain-containing protein n=1 Tax=Lactuca saligna TaxID=75948 RepID=A0AA36DZ71_LACSI|nr:unnamed protein product [Lactuca saligna]